MTMPHMTAPRSRVEQRRQVLHQGQATLVQPGAILLGQEAVRQGIHARAVAIDHAADTIGTRARHDFRVIVECRDTIRQIA